MVFKRKHPPEGVSSLLEAAQILPARGPWQGRDLAVAAAVGGGAAGVLADS